MVLSIHPVLTDVHGHICSSDKVCSHAFVLSQSSDGYCEPSLYFTVWFIVSVISLSNAFAICLGGSWFVVECVCILFMISFRCSSHLDVLTTRVLLYHE